MILITADTTGDTAGSLPLPLQDRSFLGGVLKARVGHATFPSSCCDKMDFCHPGSRSQPPAPVLDAQQEQDVNVGSVKPPGMGVVCYGSAVGPSRL